MNGLKAGQVASSIDSEPFSEISAQALLLAFWSAVLAISYKPEQLNLQESKLPSD
jgi:hypothetical protein